MDEYEFTREDDIGEVVGAEITTGGSDGFLFDWVNVRSSGDSKNRFLYLYNTDKQWLSRDSDEGVRGIRLYPQVNIDFLILKGTFNFNFKGTFNYNSLKTIY